MQQGISARVHERGYYAPMEDFNLDIRRYVLERIGDARRGRVTRRRSRRTLRIARRRSASRVRWKIYLFLFAFGFIAYLQQRSITVAGVPDDAAAGPQPDADRLVFEWPLSSATPSCSSPAGCSASASARA